MTHRPMKDASVCWWTGALLVFLSAGLRLLGWQDLSESAVTLGIGAHVGVAATYVYGRWYSRYGVDVCQDPDCACNINPQEKP